MWIATGEMPEGIHTSPACLAFLAVAFAHPGTYAAVIFVDGAERARAELQVVGAVQQPLAGAG